jgi:dipeptidyl aminopeptidase/acylaminoacyl peptidase
MKKESRLLNSSWTALVLVALVYTGVAFAQGPDGRPRRPMTFMDVMTMRSAGSPALSPDGKWMLYTLSMPDWKAAKSFSDIYLVSTEKGVESTRQMTFTKDKNETSPKWSRDGKFFVFASNREAPAPASREGGSSAGREGSGREENQLYMMRPDGGEARKITDAKDGVGAFAFSRDGKWLAFSAGKPDDQHIWILPVAGIETEAAKPLSVHVTPITWWQFSPDSRRIYFLSPDSVDKDNKERIEKKFDVKLRNQDSPVVRLWAVDLDTKKETRLTPSPDYTVSNVTISKNSKWIGFHGTPNNRYMRTVTEAEIYADVYLLDSGSGKIERLTDNKEIGESALSFSPDSTMISFAADDDFTYFRNRRIYIRAVQDAGGKWRKLGSNFDGDCGIGFWSKDGKKIYFNHGLRAAEQLFAVSVDTGNVTQVTDAKGLLTVTQDDESGGLLVHYTDPATPSDYYAASSLEKIGDRASWKRLTDANPQVRNIALGETEAVQWKSSDGRTVEGVLVKPVGYEKGKRYPLIVQIHGGPAGASMLGFSGNYGNYSNVFAGAGYACLLPNYRGSINYGEKFKMEIARDYFRLGYDDIISGVDYLIGAGLADPDKMGVMGWSAGGHWSNWILTHTNRFKAISSGAGAMNWISMYAESDIQRNREFYYGGQPYDNFEHYWDVSPLKYIKNAKTPTLIHVVDGDPRVPRPQSEELHMALKKLGVPTEFLVYPGNTHGIPDPRNQMVKMVAEFNWFEKWIRGKSSWFDWKELTQTLKDAKAEEPKKETPDQD